MMKAVEFSYCVEGGFIPFGRAVLESGVSEWEWWETQLKYGVAGAGYVLKVNYDNGQRFTFKPKGQTNDR